jgi:hypothetical protein
MSAASSFGGAAFSGSGSGNSVPFQVGGLDDLAIAGNGA